MPLLEIDALSVAYGEVVAVRGVSMAVDKGQVVSILGANGAGKSSLFKAVMGLARTRAGQVRLEGEDVTGQATHAVVRRGVTLCPEGRRLFPLLTVRENIRMGAYLGATKAEFANRLDYIHSLFPKVLERANQLAGSLSGGEQQMVAIGRALMSNPRVLLMDEPTLGLAPKMIQEVSRIVHAINQTGVAILLVEQNARMALMASQYAYVMRTGSLLREGSSAELLEDKSIQQIYLGGG